MGLFTPVKKHANKFRYIPRYYDPEKERRDQRRKELCGTSSQDDGEYTPGQYIRTQREARRAAKSGNVGVGKGKISSMAFIVLMAALLIGAYALYPRIVRSLSNMGDNAMTMEERRQQIDNEVWPYRYANIEIIPNEAAVGENTDSLATKAVDETEGLGASKEIEPNK